MNRRGSAADWLVGLSCVLCLLGSGCGRGKPKPLPPPVASASHVPCEGGETRDPPHQEVRPAIQALRGKDYDSAVRLLEALLPKYPESSSLRVWLGDARAGVGTDASVQAASDSYSEALALAARGCKLREREQFFIAVGMADVEIRQKNAARALEALSAAEARWPGNAEVAYDRARVECLRERRDACFDELKSALRLAQSREHSRFSRSHHFSDRLAERAASQPEFEVLRKQPRYRALLATVSDAGVDDAERVRP